jgi:S-adenosylmethionine-diacylglycerol 3-amino-3-carboxypropyl transferase
MRREAARSMNLDVLRYSQVWEDHLLLERGLQVGPEDDVLSICSAGCNSLALLLMGARSVTAIDMSPAQTALLELKIAGIRHLSHEDFVVLLGVREGDDRLAIYHRLRPTLPEAAAAWWDANGALVEAGINNGGRLDRYFHGFRTRHLPEVWPEDMVDRLLAAPDLESQRALFARGDTPAFREKLCWYFGREMMEKQGRDPAQFKHVPGGDLGAHFHGRLVWAVTQLPVRGNFYLEAFFRGRYASLEHAQPYLHPENFRRLKGLVDRLTVVQDELERLLTRLPAGTFSKANLSDIFEYMSPELSDQVFAALADRMRPGGRLAYWNLLVPRASPERLRDRLMPLESLSDRLSKEDRAFFYRAFHVEALR